MKKKGKSQREQKKNGFEKYIEEKRIINNMLDQNVCLEVKESKEKVLKERTKLDPG